MADPNLTKAERRQAAAGSSKAERREAKLRRKRGDDSAAEPARPDAPGKGASGAGIEARLARLEQAVATQAELSERLLAKLEEVLPQGKKATRRKKGAAGTPVGQTTAEEPAAAPEPDAAGEPDAGQDAADEA